MEKEKEKNNDFIFYTLFGFAVGLSAFLIFYLVSDNRLNSNYEVLGAEIIEDCEGLDFRTTSDCLWRYMNNSLYKYNESNIYPHKMTFEELKEQGGVCGHYANWYVYQFRRLGFDAQFVNIAGHVFVVASGNTGYCILDMINIKCFEVKYEEIDYSNWTLEDFQRDLAGEK